MPSSRIVTCYPGVGILTKINYHFVTRLNAGLFRFRGRYVQRNSEHCVSFHQRLVFHTILENSISLNVGTGYYIINEKEAILLEPYSHSTFTLIFITPF
jgi:hypothetical protein